MVDLPSGKMKSREGTVVDADDLMDVIIKEAKRKTAELGKTDGLNEDDLNNLYHTMGLGALKYYILKVDPTKRMLFNPAESIELNGNTGPFIQYTYTRIRSILRSHPDEPKPSVEIYEDMHDAEKEVARLLHQFPTAVETACVQYSPAQIANYVYELTKAYNRMYHEVSILKEPVEYKKSYRLCLTQFTGSIIKKSLHLMGIETVEQM
jgi:arginyl-tRNA synthetase